MKSFDEILTDDIRRIALTGHVRPDGDCVGAVTGVWHYLKDNYPDREAVVFLEKCTDSLTFLEEGIAVRADEGEEGFDLALSIDTSDPDRIGAGKQAFLLAKRTAVIDHHESNRGFASVNHIEGGASSVSEVLVRLMDIRKIGREAATAFYTGIIHDTGVFRYDSVTAETLRTAALLIEKDVPFQQIIEKSVTDMEYREMKIVSRVVLESRYYEEERLLVGVAPFSMQQEYGVYAKDLGAVVTQLNYMKGADIVLLLYEYEDGSYKGSLRAKGEISVSALAAHFGGGGHKRASGFSTLSAPEEVIEKLREQIRQEMKA